MPKGVPVATVAIGNAANAGLLALRILACSDSALQQKMLQYQVRPISLNPCPQASDAVLVFVVCFACSHFILMTLTQLRLVCNIVNLMVATDLVLIWTAFKLCKLSQDGMRDTVLEKAGKVERGPQ